MAPQTSFAKRLIPLVFVLAAAGYAQAPLRGFPEQEWAARHAFEEKLRAIPESQRIGRHIQRMASEPHHAGSPASRAVAEYARALFREWGLEAEIEEFEALLPYPGERIVELVSPRKFKASLKEPRLNEDKDTGHRNQIPAYNAYSGSGDVTAPLVYANYGMPADYEVLSRHGIDVKGKIVIVRYGGGWRGTKAKLAAEHGAAGCLIYSDPRDDGYFRGDVYPKGPFRPPHGVQRGSVLDMPLAPGDPLTPGWASEKGARRLSREEAPSIMKIPVLPISYADAEPLLAELDGPVAPEPWRGSLPITYHLGPGPATVRLKVESDWSQRPVYNVVATIPGAVWPDAWILYGNHHDAWVHGAHDPASGAAVVLETARTLAEMQKQGWRPKRTLKFALWDAEEFGLVGSTEWVEKHREELRRKLVAYINSDSNGKGSLHAGGSHTLEHFVLEVMRDNADPETGKNLLDAARERGRSDGNYRLTPLGAGSDYVAFVHHAGIASLNLGFTGADPGGIYHSIYDTYRWYTNFSDGGFVFGRALTQVMATALSRLTDAPVLPFEFGRFTRTVTTYLKDIVNEAGKDGARLDLTQVIVELNRLSTAERAYEIQLARLLPKLANQPPERLAELNRALYGSERALLHDAGLPGRDWYRHLIYAPGLYTGYGAKTLPGIREAMERKRIQEANVEAKKLAEVLNAMHAKIEQATRLLTEVEGQVLGGKPKSEPGRAGISGPWLPNPNP